MLSTHFSPWELVAIAGVFLVAGTVKGGIGLGLPTVSMGLMAAWLPVDRAAALIVLPVILTNVWQGFVGSAFPIVMRRLWSLMIALVAGTLVAAVAIAQANEAVAAGLLGGMLMVYAGLGLGGWQFDVPVRVEPVLSPVIGFATGLISGATAIFVIPSVPYLQSLEFRRSRHRAGDDDPARATTDNQAKDALIQSLGLTALVATMGLALGLGVKGHLPVSTVIPGSIATLAAFAGMTIGRTIRNRLPIEVFRRWVLVGLLALGVAMVVRSVG